MTITAKTLLNGSKAVDEMKADIDLMMNIIKGALLVMREHPDFSASTRLARHWSPEVSGDCTYWWQVLYTDEAGGKVTDIRLWHKQPNGETLGVYSTSIGTLALDRVAITHDMLDLLVSACLSQYGKVFALRVAPYIAAAIWAERK